MLTVAFTKTPTTFPTTTTKPTTTDTTPRKPTTLNRGRPKLKKTPETAVNDSFLMMLAAQPSICLILPVPL